jgi:hypothetical protein
MNDKSTNSDLGLTEDELMRKYGDPLGLGKKNKGTHPEYTLEKWVASGTDERDYWKWVRTSINESTPSAPALVDEKTTNSDLGLTEAELMHKYGDPLGLDKKNKGTHPQFTLEMWVASGSEERDYWKWVRNCVNETPSHSPAPAAA